jgi:small subunit ribosomal protein S6
MNFMALYEHVFIARQDITSQQMEDLITQYTGIIADNGGAVVRHEYWGVKTLAYRVQKNRKAHYALMMIDAPSKAVLEMERLQKINEDVLRSLTIRVEALEEGPSAMLMKRERDEKIAREFETERTDDDYAAKPRKSGGGRFRDDAGSDVE